MFAKIHFIWNSIRDSLWFIPTLFTLGSIFLAVILVTIEQEFNLNFKEFGWALDSRAEGSRQVLATIAGSLITVTGVLFSVTIVALQLASSQFTPRILRNYISNRSNQVVLGVFISTFTYTLLILRVIRAKDENGIEFVPQIAVAVAIVLALVSIGFLIHFIHHIAMSIQPSVILDRITDEALLQVNKQFPRNLGNEDSHSDDIIETPETKSHDLTFDKEGYLQLIDGRALFDKGQKDNLVIRMVLPIGSFIVKGQKIAEYWANNPCTEEELNQLRSAFVVGPIRSPEQDIECCIVEISDIAVKALSPGINDPTTARYCINRLTQIIATFGKLQPPEIHKTEDGKIHFIALRSTIDTVLDTAFSQIIHFGVSNPVIIKSIGESLRILADLLPQTRKKRVLAYAERMEINLF